MRITGIGVEQQPELKSRGINIHQKQIPEVYLVQISQKRKYSNKGDRQQYKQGLPSVKNR